MKKSLIFIFLSLLFIAGGSCNRSGSSDKGTEFIFPESDSVPVDESVKLSEEAIADIVQNISSPVEIASLLQALEVPYSAEFLATTSGSDQLSTNFQKALKLGIYGADLGYLNMYEKTGTSIDVLTTIKKLADGIRVGQFFDYETLKRLSINKSNVDSLLYLSLQSYNKIDDYLRSNDRGYLSALLVVGVWIEGQYLATQVVKSYPDKMLVDRIGEQKIIINDLLLLLRPYKKTSQEYDMLYDGMERLSAKYKDVRITYTLGEPEMIEQDGRLVVTQNETSLVEMTDEQLKSIIHLTDSLRNSLVAKVQ